MSCMCSEGLRFRLMSKKLTPNATRLILYTWKTSIILTPRRGWVLRYVYDDDDAADADDDED